MFLLSAFKASSTVPIGSYTICLRFENVAHVQVMRTLRKALKVAQHKHQVVSRATRAQYGIFLFVGQF